MNRFQEELQQKINFPNTLQAKFQKQCDEKDAQINQLQQVIREMKQENETFRLLLLQNHHENIDIVPPPYNRNRGRFTQNKKRTNDRIIFE